MKNFLVVISKSMFISAINKDQAIEKAYRLLPKKAVMGRDIISSEVHGKDEYEVSKK